MFCARHIGDLHFGELGAICGKERAKQILEIVIVERTNELVAIFTEESELLLFNTSFPLGKLKFIPSNLIDCRLE